MCITPSANILHAKVYRNPIKDAITCALRVHGTMQQSRLSTARVQYNRATASLDAAFNNLAALMETHIVVDTDTTGSKFASKLLSGDNDALNTDPYSVDIMQEHRSLIEQGLNDLRTHSLSILQGHSSSEDSVLARGNDTIQFRRLLET